MKIYIDFEKQSITKIEDADLFVGDINSNTFIVLFSNVNEEFITDESTIDFYPTLTQLAPNGREAGPFLPDALEDGETIVYNEDNVNYLKYQFTMNQYYALMDGRSNFFVYINKEVNGGLNKKVYAKFNCVLNVSDEQYFISDPAYNPQVKAYIDSSFENMEKELDDYVEAKDTEIDGFMDDATRDLNELSGQVEATLDTANETISTAVESMTHPTYSDISNLPTSDVGLVVGSDGYIYAWDSANGEYVNTNIAYQATQIADGEVTYSKLAMQDIIDNFNLSEEEYNDFAEITYGNVLDIQRLVNKLGVVNSTMTISTATAVFFKKNGTLQTSITSDTKQITLKAGRTYYALYKVSSAGGLSGGQVLCRLFNNAYGVVLQFGGGNTITINGELYWAFYTTPDEDKTGYPCFQNSSNPSDSFIAQKFAIFDATKFKGVDESGYDGERRYLNLDTDRVLFSQGYFVYKADAPSSKITYEDTNVESALDDILDKLEYTNEGLVSPTFNFTNFVGEDIKLVLAATSCKNELGKNDIAYTVTDGANMTYLCPSTSNSFVSNSRSKYITIEKDHIYMIVMSITHQNVNGFLDSCMFIYQDTQKGAANLRETGQSGIYASVIKATDGGYAFPININVSDSRRRYTNGDTINAMAVIDLTAQGNEIAPSLFVGQTAVDFFDDYKDIINDVFAGTEVFTSGKVYGAPTEQDLDDGTNLTELGTFEATEVGETKEIDISITNSIRYVTFKETNGFTIRLSTTTKLADYTRFKYKNLQSLDERVIDLIETNQEMGIENKWKDKNYVAFGTSITATNNTLAPDGTATGKFIPYLLNYLNINNASFKDRAVAGASFCGHILYYVQYYTTDEAIADLITVEGGVNDWASSKPLGQVGDTIAYASGNEGFDYGGSSNGTFAGAVYQTLKTLQGNAPKAKIIVLTDNTGQYIPSTGADCRREKQNSLGLTQYDYTKMLIDVAHFMGVEVIDAGQKSQINEQHSEYLIDQIHQTSLGGKQYALTIWNELKFISPLEQEE